MSRNEAGKRSIGSVSEPAKRTGREVDHKVEVSASPTAQGYLMTVKPLPSRKPENSRGVVDGKPISLPKPVYPRTALANGLFGRVVVELTIDEKGYVINARAVRGNAMLRPSALTAARNARFEPTLLSGQPVKVTRLIDYDFNKPN